MGNNWASNIFLLVTLVLVQGLVCNNIMLFNVAMAFVFIYLIIRLPMDLNPNILLTMAFISGLLVDMFADTPGVNALSCTILAMLKRPAFYAYVPRDDRTKSISPSISTLGFSDYAKYLLSMSAIYCVLVFTIEYFNLADVKEIVIMTASSAALTFLTLLGVDCLVSRKR